MARGDDYPTQKDQARMAPSIASVRRKGLPKPLPQSEIDGPDIDTPVETSTKRRFVGTPNQIAGTTRGPLTNADDLYADLSTPSAKRKLGGVITKPITVGTRAKPRGISGRR